MPMASMIASTATATIISTRVKPRLGIAQTSSVKGATANAAREHGRSGYNPGPGRQSGLGDIWEGRHNGGWLVRPGRCQTVCTHRPGGGAPATTERPEIQWLRVSGAPAVLQLPYGGYRGTGRTGRSA